MMTDREWIDNYFQTFQTGRFLDIGAFDGYNSSLTDGLAQKGWMGVLVEPNPKHFLALQAHHYGNPRLRLVNMAVSPTENNYIPFWCDNRPGGEVSTLSKEWRKHFASNFNVSYETHWLPAITIDRLLTIFGGPRYWDFVKIDAEGVSIDLCCQLPLAEMKETEIICCERSIMGLTKTTGQDELEAYLAPYYTIEVRNDTNLIARRK